MAVDYDLYRPLLIDEHLNMLDIDNDGDKDATLCRAAASLMAGDAVTGGELTTTQKGGKWGRAKIRAVLGKMRQSTGAPKRPGYNQSHVAGFVKAMGLPADSYERFNKSMGEAKAKLKQGYVVTVAGDVGLTPYGSPLRRYVNPGVGHEIIITRVTKDGTKAAFIDPMTPHGTKVYERWAPWSHFVAFAKRFGAPGARIMEIWKRGKYAKASIQARQKREYRDNLTTAVIDLTESQRRVGELEEDVALLERQLEEAQNSNDKERIRDLEIALNEIKDTAGDALA